MTTQLGPRSWFTEESEAMVRATVDRTVGAAPAQVRAQLDELILVNSQIHDDECVNLNPATNTMSPAAVRALTAGLSPRTSLGNPGAKYEMGLEAIEQIEITASQLAAQLFDAPYVEFRVPSGAMANLMVFMATAQPGDAIIVPPATIAGHVTHHQPGAAGLYGLEIHEAPIDPDRYTVDVAGLADLADRVRPALITLGSSLNLRHHDVAGVADVAAAVGATFMFDAAHLSGPIAGDAWPDPLAAGADVMTMSTYKSLAGPTAGLVLTHDAALAQRVDEIAFPGLTANFDVGKTAALAYTLTEWLAHGTDYAATMVTAAAALADALRAEGVEVFDADGVATESHAFALDARALGGGMHTAQQLRRHQLLASAIGLPTGSDDGVRIGTNELVRWGATPADMSELAGLIARALRDDDGVAVDVQAFRQRFDTLHFTLDG